MLREHILMDTVTTYGVTTSYDEVSHLTGGPDRDAHSLNCYLVFLNKPHCSTGWKNQKEKEFAMKILDTRLIVMQMIFYVYL